MDHVVSGTPEKLSAEIDRHAVDKAVLLQSSFSTWDH